MIFLNSYAEFLLEGKSSRKRKKNPCWPGYRQVGLKTKNGRRVPNCVPGGVSESVNPSSPLSEFGDVFQKFSPGQEQELLDYIETVPPRMRASIGILPGSFVEAERVLGNYGNVYFLNKKIVCTPFKNVFIDENGRTFNWEEFRESLNSSFNDFDPLEATEEEMDVFLLISALIKLGE